MTGYKSTQAMAIIRHAKLGNTNFQLATKAESAYYAPRSSQLNRTPAVHKQFQGKATPIARHVAPNGSNCFL